MDEKWLGVNQIRKRLGCICISTFKRLEPKLVARGVKKTKIGKRWMYDNKSFNYVLRGIMDDEMQREAGL